MQSTATTVPPKATSPLSNLPPIHSSTLVEAPPPGSSIYTASVKDPAEIKSPELPLKEAKASEVSRA